MPTDHSIPDYTPRIGREVIGNIYGIPFSCINYFRELTERLRSQGSNELFLCILNATTDGFQKHQCNGVSYRYPKAQLDLRPSFYATLGSILTSRICSSCSPCPEDHPVARPPRSSPIHSREDHGYLVKGPHAPARQRGRHATTAWHPRCLGLPHAYILGFFRQRGIEAKKAIGFVRVRGQARRMTNPPDLDKRKAP